MEETLKSYVIIEKAGLFDTLQDEGRLQYRSSGVPTSGPMDVYSYNVGNLLLGNERNATSIEITMLGPHLRFSDDTEIAITGADMNPTLNGKPIELWSTQHVRSNDQLNFSGALDGCRCYLAIKGGFQVPTVMGSSSTYTRAKLGGLTGSTLRAGDKISYGIQRKRNRRHKESAYKIEKGTKLSHDYQPIYDEETVSLHVIVGPQEDVFSKESLVKFFKETYVVSKDMDRMGIRLDGDPLAMQKGFSMITDAVTYGSIQITANGLPVILGADGQTTGGYPKIGTIISTDLPKVGQLRPLQKIIFIPITIEDAQKEYRRLQRFYATVRVGVMQK